MIKFIYIYNHANEIPEFRNTMAGPGIKAVMAVV